MNDPKDKDAAELRVLRAKLARLPRTADGVPMLPGMEVFYVWDGYAVTGRDGVKFGPCVLEARIMFLELRRGGKLVAVSEESPATDPTFYGEREAAEEAADRLRNRKARRLAAGT